jgi:peptidoglycan/xylan/chitin deacetylase (PgdA/CDA1 family)
MLYHGNPKYHEVALTVDDGPNRIYGPQILGVLEQYHVPATFFVVGVRVKDSPGLIRRMVADGDEVGNHTYDHQRLNRLKPHQIANELRDDDINIFEAAGVHTTVMRPPGEDFNNTVLHVNKALGYVTVYWTDAAKDYLQQSPEWIADRIMDRVENGSIILLHQDTPDTAKALPVIIAKLRAQGYHFVTINTMLAQLGVQPYLAEEQKNAPPNPTKLATRLN